MTAMPIIRAAVIPAPGFSAEVRELPEPALEPDSADAADGLAAATGALDDVAQGKVIKALIDPGADINGEAE